MTQAFWLHQAFQLEFMGFSTFVPGLWFAGLGFFLVNCWILGVIVSDVGKWDAKGTLVRRQGAVRSKGT
jgi:phosphatidylinositol glycan class M